MFATGSSAIDLDFTSLPSTQGWTYSAVGVHNGQPEASIYAVDGTALLENSLGKGIDNVGGAAFYSIANVLCTNLDVSFKVRARVLEIEGNTSFANYGYGFSGSSQISV
jgi:hypothetical protein